MHPFTNQSKKWEERNIKRAKLLKKRKKQKIEEEQVKLQKTKHLEEFQKNHKAAGHTLQVNRGPVKYSDLLLDFIRPELTGDEDEERFRRLLYMGLVSWNIGLVKQKDPERYATLCDEFYKEQGFHVAVLDDFIARKINDFPEHNFLFSDFSVRGIKNEFHVTVSGKKIYE